eukprot:TRINITY_DN9346_c0_g1_i1.p1 TRINITY_DN9346_c0_g1~~TRINITY_DN9346_c0_g1_i1.p1  ORF type:complete len:142 (+),score=12.55 TRINITY_DN9346_c0_g1_i1:106-531(+)
MHSFARTNATQALQDELEEKDKFGKPTGFMYTHICTRRAFERIPLVALRYQDYQNRIWPSANPLWGCYGPPVNPPERDRPLVNQEWNRPDPWHIPKLDLSPGPSPSPSPSPSPRDKSATSSGCTLSNFNSGPEVTTPNDLI